jgi:hypothetical protein
VGDYVSDAGYNKDCSFFFTFDDVDIGLLTEEGRFFKDSFTEEGRFFPDSFTEEGIFFPDSFTEGMVVVEV